MPGGGASSTWPLVGRDDEFELVRERIVGATPGSLVIAGAGGVGKTRLAQEAVDVAEAVGKPVARASASKSGATIPFGALAGLLPADDRLSETPVALLRRAVTAIAGRAPGGRLVLWIDDAHNLDDASAVLVHQLALDGRVSLVLTVRTGEVAPDPIDLLWKDGLAERIELQPLSRRETDELVGHVLGGDVDAVLLDRLWRTSTGNPLYLRELINEAQSSGAFRREAGLWRIVGAFHPPQRLVELLEARLSALPSDDIDLVEFVAVAGEIGLVTLEEAHGVSRVERLERVGLLNVTTDERRRPVRLAHPLYGEVLRDRMPASRTRALERRVAGLIESFGARRRGDVLRVAILRLDTGDAVPAALLERAASDAYFTYDFALAEKIARSALDAGAGWETTRLLAEILRYAGNHRGADEVLAAIDEATLTDDRARALVGMARAENLFRGLVDEHGARRALLDARNAVVDPCWRGEMTALHASFDLMVGDVGRALEQVTPLLAGPADRALAAACVVGSLALALTGRCDDAVRVADRGLEVAMSLGPQPLVNDPATHVVMRCLAHALAGRVREAEEQAQGIYDWVVASGISMGQAWLGLVLGYAALGMGRIVRAEHLFREAAVGSQEVNDKGLERWSWSGAAHACALRGDATAAQTCIELMDACVETPVEVTLIQLERARAWTAVARGEHTNGRTGLLAAASHAKDSGAFALEAETLHDVVRLGDATCAVERLSALVDEVQGSLIGIRAAHARALAGGDADGLMQASISFEEVGHVLSAAEASSQASRVFHRSGRARLATAAANRSRTLAAWCEGARTPALEAAEETIPLTKREHEIASLAAGGLSSKQIADRLVVSVRTVENLLQRAYTKLGVRGRDELAGRLSARQE